MNKITSFPRLQTMGEEIANSVLHGIGALLSLIGFIPLVAHVNGGINGKTIGIVSCIIYASTIFIMFMSSTLYHASVKKSIKKVMRILDHSAIYLLIVGTYTPICLIILPKNIGLVILLFQSVCAISGIVFNALNFAFIKKIEVLLYCIMGLTIFAAAPYFNEIPFFCSCYAFKRRSSIYYRPYFLQTAAKKTHACSMACFCTCRRNQPLGICIFDCL
ncbi:MAG: hypothetical protein Ta2G_11540 [Termitinemataceae bacterium]|nr:MAG: hypothetical protein Ta2G_11540 [Termitinemataceae bacterium]